MKVTLSTDEHRALLARNVEVLDRLAEHGYHLGSVGRERSTIYLAFWRGNGGDRDWPDAEVAEGEMEIWLQELDRAVKPKQLSLL